MTLQLKRVEETVYDEMKNRILEWRLAPGTRLIIRNVAKDLGVSPSPVILALRMLEKDGLVVTTPGLGTCVRTWTFDEVVRLFQIRAALEGLACRLCAEQARASDLEAIADANEEIRRSFEAGDDEAFRRADLEFHRAIIRGAHCDDLERMTEYPTVLALSLRVPRMLHATGGKVHDILVEAIMRRDSVAAENAGKEHTEDSLESHREWLKDVCAAMVQESDVQGGTPVR